VASKRLPRVSVDTCVILNVLVNGPNDAPNWLPRSKWVLDAHGVSHDVALPALVLAELGGDPSIRGDDLERSERKRRIKLVREWIDDCRFIIIDIDERVGREASELAAKWQLKGADAAMLAATKLWSIPILYTWDKALLKIDSQIDGLLVKAPELTSESPSEQQGDLFQADPGH
jgi:predicted nucleic acid-binding protein